MTLVFVAYGLSIIIGILLLVRVFKASVLDGILTFFVPFYFIVPLIKHWSEPDHDIKYHVVALLGCIGLAFWGVTHVAGDIANNPGAFLADGFMSMTTEDRRQYVQELRDEGITISPADEQALISGNKEEVGRALSNVMGRGSERGNDTPVQDSAETPPGGVTRARDAEFDNPRPVAAVERPTETISYAEAARRAVFNRGRWTRDSTGFSIDVPAKFRLISAADARRLDRARARTEDSRIMAWILHEDTPLADPDSWHVKVRWISDGWVATQALEPVQLLQAALDNKQPQPRVAASSGDLLGYAVAPRFDGQVLEWAEERVLVNSDQQVVDCHALRPGRRGVLEYSILGMAPGQLALCQATVRLLADRTRFLEGKEYPAAPPDGLRAPYTLAALATHTP